MALEVKNSPANAGDLTDVGLIPGPGRSPGKGNGNPLQYSCLENPMLRHRSLTGYIQSMGRLSIHTGILYFYLFTNSGNLLRLLNYCYSHVQFSQCNYFSGYGKSDTSNRPLSIYHIKKISIILYLDFPGHTHKKNIN